MHLHTSTSTTLLLAFTLTLSFVQSQQTTSGGETHLATYLYHRHGDRTSKSTPPTRLTPLGSTQIAQSASFFRRRYLSPSSPFRIDGIARDLVDLEEFTISAPEGDEVLEASAGYFARGLYPPFEGNGSGETLRNGSNVDAPDAGSQIVPVRSSSSSPAAGSSSSSGESSKDKENTAWLQSASSCDAAKTSSNSYFYSPRYTDLLESTRDFYQSLDPVTNDVFPEGNLTYKNAYAIFDYINVAAIHNQTGTIDRLENEEQTLGYLQALAGLQQFGLAFDESDTVRAVEGMSQAGNVLSFFEQVAGNATAGGGGSANVTHKLNVEFGAYSTFLSFFGLSGLSQQYPDTFQNRIPDYASVMGFDLFTPSGDEMTEDNLLVRFLFHNGTLTDPEAEEFFQSYTLLNSTSDGNSDTVMSYRAFRNHLTSFAVRNEREWCDICGCSSSTSAASDAGGSTSGDGGGGNGLSKAEAGVIGAFVTLGVLLLAAGLVWFVLGRRRTRKGEKGEAGGGVKEVDEKFTGEK
ncbi:MAG: hypothetical protein M1831_006824 [Alyxoria varia]|nr:MAG: hypothetical protein M1831_006824 [Alyxoria varia]